MKLNKQCFNFSTNITDQASNSLQKKSKSNQM